TAGPQAVVGLPFAYIIEAQDADGDALMFDLTTAPAGATITPINGLPNRAILTWTPAAAGPSKLLVQASDGRGGTTTQAVTVTAVDAAANHAPEISSAPRTKIPNGRTYVYLPAVTDEDNDPLTFALDDGPAGMSIDPQTGLIAWTPAPDQFGPFNVSLSVSD